MLLLRTGLSLLMKMLSFTWRRWGSFSLPMNVKSSRVTDLAAQQFDLTCWRGAYTWTPVTGLPVRAEMCVCVFLQTFFPKPFRRAYVTEIALSASVLVDDARQQGLGKFVFEGEARWHSLLRLEHDLQFGKGNNVTKTTDDTVLNVPRCGTQW